MNIDTERVISEVHLRPPLWDLSCVLYKDRDAKIKAWREVCQAIVQNFDHVSDNEKKVIERNVQQRWKTARDAYVRCKATMKNTKSGSAGSNKKKYVYFDCMQFLDKKHVIDTEDSIVENQSTMDESNNKPTTNDDALPSTSKDSNFCQPEQTTAAERKNMQTKRFKKRTRNEDDNFDREMLNMFKENTKLMQNDDMSFFCSLLPIMKTFSNHQKLLFRSAVLQKAIEISSNSSEIRPGTSHTFSTSESQHSDASTSYITEVPQQFEEALDDDSTYSLEDFVTMQNL
ncbi:uncharacterized protein LOC112600442 isoform X1 [Melanaphis sacchari]|uniref:uncharacterized protein LOC112598226 isoform X1 n=1 Tax=Melanaphis sacchari TaxID=742174 RepID=UPI000DC141BA|nr:uncharacterized protein LOC112598226 isoform X1 [Melanaphis sacchari]XP_025203446.1 uncharacterized protein LOC112600442 isoform X1 [Melanaphis sacchari]